MSKSDKPSVAVESVDAGIPRYRQIATDILASISADDYPVGSSLPTEAELCDAFKASRFTVREALRWLADHGIIDRKRGAGTTVLANGPSSAFVYRLSSIDEILKYPENTYRENLFTGTIHADPDLANKIDCPVGSEWFRISGLRRSDSGSVPISWSDIYIVPEFSSVVQEQEKQRIPVYEQIAEATGTTIFDAEINIFASSIDGKLAGLLQVARGTPALSIIRRYYDEAGRNFETTITVHPEKRFEYSMQLHRDRIGSNKRHKPKISSNGQDQS
jgi:DNA-binding GntR family transcriptional regulator